MPRPRKNQEGPTAVERIETAFWDILAEKPYAKISVGEIARQAQINKNAFYYHFDNLDDLAKTAVENALPVELLRAVLSEFMGKDAGFTLLVTEPENLRRFDRICLVVGHHGTPALQETLKAAMRSAWRDVLGIRVESFGAEPLLMMEFVFGGLFSLWAYRAENLPDMTLQDLFEADLMRLLQQTLPSLVLATFEKDGAIDGSSPLRKIEATQHLPRLAQV